MGYRTDLAMEGTQALREELPGLEQGEESLGKLTIHTVRITDEHTGELVGKPVGEYVTVTSPPLYSTSEFSEEETEAIAGRIQAMLPADGLVLVVGLGNNDITPDAVGPRTVNQVLATRHLSGTPALQNELPDLRAVAAIAPGVLGQTGIETSEIIRSLVADIQPVAVIVIDALAARSAARLGNTIQISNTGISPGSGVMNRRKELSSATLGVPVVSIGIPTVVDATTLASDLLEDQHDSVEKRRELFEPGGQAMMITPREIDVLIDHACHVLSMSINKALQPNMSFEEIEYLVS